MREHSGPSPSSDGTVEALEGWIREERDALLVDAAPASAHLADERLARLGPGELREEEIAHLAECSECRELVAALEMPAPQARVLRGPWQRAGAMAFAAAAALLLVWWPISQGERSGEYAVRGEAQTFGAQVVLIATGADQRRREVQSGATLRLGDRLGFRYGNPTGAYSQLSILGWDGQQLHWYYPEAPGEAPVALKKGEGALGVRLPFDIALGKKHRAGALTVVAAFDVEPQALATQLKQGTLPPEGRALKRWQLTLERSDAP